MVKKNLFLTPPSLTEIQCPSISFLSLSLSFYLATSSATTCSRGMCLLHFHNVKLSLIACQVSSMIASCIAFASRIAFTWKKKKKYSIGFGHSPSFSRSFPLFLIILIDIRLISLDPL